MAEQEDEMRLDFHATALQMVQKRLLSYAPPGDNGEGDKKAKGEEKLVSDTLLRLMLADIDDAFSINDELADLLRQSADDLITTILEGACSLAKHRGSDTVVANDASAYNTREYSRVKRARRSRHQQK